MKYKQTLRDGNCLFNAVECVLEYEETGLKLNENKQKKNASELRSLTIKYLRQLVKEDDLIRFMMEEDIKEDDNIFDILDYFEVMGKDGEWGGNIEIIAISKMLNRSIEIYHKKKREYKIMGGYKIEKNKNKPIKLFYRGQSHYDFFI